MSGRDPNEPFAKDGCKDIRPLTFRDRMLDGTIVERRSITLEENEAELASLKRQLRRFAR